MFQWFKSDINHELYTLIELLEVKNAEGKLRFEPHIRGFIHLRQSRIWYAYANYPNPIEIAVTPTMRVFEAKKAVEAVAKNQS